MTEASLLIGGLVAVFGGVIFWAIVIQPRAERARASLGPDEAWKASGLENLRTEGYELLQVVPTAEVTTAEFIFQDENQREIGRFTSGINKSAQIMYDGKTVRLFIQGAPLGGTLYTGKVGGRTDNSTVIRDEQHVIAEIWRETAIPPIHYRMEYSGEMFDITTGGVSPVAPGTITRAGEQLGAFRRNAIGSRNIFVAVRKDLANELRVCLCSVVLLE